MDVIKRQMMKKSNDALAISAVESEEQQAKLNFSKASRTSGKNNTNGLALQSVKILKKFKGILARGIEQQ